MEFWVWYRLIFRGQCYRGDRWVCLVYVTRGILTSNIDRPHLVFFFEERCNGLGVLAPNPKSEDSEPNAAS